MLDRLRCALALYAFATCTICAGCADESDAVPAGTGGGSGTGGTVAGTGGSGSSSGTSGTGGSAQAGAGGSVAGSGGSGGSVGGSAGVGGTAGSGGAVGGTGGSGAVAGSGGSVAPDFTVTEEGTFAPVQITSGFARISHTQPWFYGIAVELHEKGSALGCEDYEAGAQHPYDQYLVLGLGATDPEMVDEVTFTQGEFPIGSTTATDPQRSATLWYYQGTALCGIDTLNSFSATGGTVNAQIVGDRVKVFVQATRNGDSYTLTADVPLCPTNPTTTTCK